MTLGEANYNAYCETVGWKSIKGDPLPQFADQSEKIRMAWENGAATAINHYLNAPTVPDGKREAEPPPEIRNFCSPFCCAA
jgi:hypothetical protein